VTIWKSFGLPPFGPHHRKQYSALVAIAVVLLFAGYGWRIRPVTSYDPSILHQVSNADLKQSEKKLADRMRDYQTDYSTTSTPLFLNAKTPADFAEVVRVGNNFRNGFHKEYYGDACAIRDEFIWRLKKMPEQAEKDVVVNLPLIDQTTFDAVSMSRALSGDLNGPRPVSDAADFLDGLARQLN
jgi:hypothetical protein